MNRVLIVLLVITLSTLSVAQEGKEKDKIEKDTPKFYSNPAEGDVNEIVAVVPGESASAKQVFNVMSKYFGKGGSKNKNAVLVVLNTNPIPRKDRKFENLDSSEMQDKDEESEEWHVCLNGTLAQIKRKYDCWNVPAHYISMYDGVLEHVSLYTLPECWTAEDDGDCAYHAR